MKRWLLIFLVLPLFSFKKEVLSINGVGEFRLGITDTSFVDSLTIAIGGMINRVDLTGDNPKPQIRRVLNETSSCGALTPGASFDNNVKIYKIDNYKLLSKYTIQTITIYFYEGKLYRVDLKNPDPLLVFDLERKYGDPRISTVDHDCTCYIGSERIEFNCSSIFRTWNSKKSRLSITMSEGRDIENCDPIATTYVYLYDVNMKEKIDISDKRAKLECEENKRKRDKEKLKDL